MKIPDYTALICKGFCAFYREGKEELHCGGYEILRHSLTSAELEALSSLCPCSDTLKHQIPPEEEEMRSLVCGTCAFAADGCDYREDRSGPPCGGYHFLRLLRAVRHGG
ncbi:MAG: hypothetical protein IT388_10765 [Nitrospirales bacterium]|nr:hypothetical protein [Nitrospirales bacterium]